MKIIKLLSLVIVFASLSSCLEKDVLYKVEGDDPNEVPPTHILKKFEIIYSDSLSEALEFNTLGYWTTVLGQQVENTYSIETSMTFNRSEDLISQIQHSVVYTPASPDYDYEATLNFTYNADNQVESAEYTVGTDVQTLELSYSGNTVTGIHKLNNVQVGEITYVYDNDGKLLSRTIADEINNNTFLATFTYSGNNVSNIKFVDNFGEYYNASFTYDNKVNPLYNQMFVDIQELIIYYLFDEFHVSSNEYYTPYDGYNFQFFCSENNFITHSSNGSTLSYTYDADNYPTSAIVTYAVSNQTNTFNYTYY